MSIQDTQTSESSNSGPVSAHWQEQEQHLSEFLDKVWNSGELDPIDQLVHTHYTIHHDPGDPWEGQTLTRRGLKERVRKSRAPFPDQCFDVQQMISCEGRTAIAWHWHGTHQEDFGHFKATGQPLTMSGMTIYFFEHGLLCGHWQMVDRLAIYHQLMAASGAERV